MYGDTKAKWDRIGGRYLFPKIAWGLIAMFILFAGIVMLATCAKYSKVADMSYKDMLDDIRYQNTHHK